VAFAHGRHPGVWGACPPGRITGAEVASAATTIGKRCRQRRLGGPRPIGGDVRVDLVGQMLAEPVAWRLTEPWVENCFFLFFFFSASRSRQTAGWTVPVIGKPAGQGRWTGAAVALVAAPEGLGRSGSPEVDPYRLGVRSPAASGPRLPPLTRLRHAEREGLDPTSRLHRCDVMPTATQE